MDYEVFLGGILMCIEFLIGMEEHCLLNHLSFID